MSKEIKKIEAYYKEYGPMILRRCRYILKDESLAYDAMHDIFVKILSKPITIKHTSSYLYRMATNHCLNMIKRNKKFSSDLEVPEVKDPNSIEEKILNSIELENLFKKVPKSSRVIAELRYVNRLKLDEIAEVVGMSQSGVRKRLRKLREISKEEIRWNE